MVLNLPQWGSKGGLYNFAYCRNSAPSYLKCSCIKTVHVQKVSTCVLGKGNYISNSDPATGLWLKRAEDTHLKWEAENAGLVGGNKKEEAAGEKK